MSRILDINPHFSNIYTNQDMNISIFELSSMKNSYLESFWLDENFWIIWSFFLHIDLSNNDQRCTTLSSCLILLIKIIVLNISDIPTLACDTNILSFFKFFYLICLII